MPFVRSLFTPRRAIGAGVAAVLITSSVTALAATSLTAPKTATSLPSVIPGWLHSAKVVGATPADQKVYVLLTLKADYAAIQAYGKAASTPGNPLYRKWLPVAQIEKEFGPAASVVTTVTDALKALGVNDIVVSKLGVSVMAQMPASLASTVFGVRFEQVMHNGESTRVALNEPTLPSVLVPYVAVVSGLSEVRFHTGQISQPALSLPPVPGVGAPPAGFEIGPSAYYGQKIATDKPAAPVLAGETGTGNTFKPYVTGGYTPAQVRGAYGLNNTTYTGKGVTAGVVLFFDGQYVEQDLTQYSKEQGLPVPDYTDLSAANAVSSDLTGAAVPSLLDASGEQTLDVEAIHTMAPDASIIYSGAQAPVDPAIDIAEDTAIAGGAQVINNSFGSQGEDNPAFNAAFADGVTGIAMAAGIGIDFSSGDAGDDVSSTGDRQADSPSTSDEVTAVGGTGIEIGKNNDYEGEYYWGTYTSPVLAAGDTAWKTAASQAGGAGGGGGLSTVYAEPDWQTKVVPAEETVNADTAAGYNDVNGSDPTYGVAGSPGRVTPDVAMIADSTTGFLVGQTQLPDVGSDGVAGDGVAAYSYYRIGGTSVSSPIFTGLMADVDEAMTTANGGTATSAGFVNPTMYPFLARHDGAFRDPSIGRAAGASRLGGTAAQTLTNCTQATAGTTDASTQTCVGTGPGVVPVVNEVRPDYTDSGNPGIADASSGTSAGPNTIVYHLRAQGVLGTLEDLPGYDDSTGLGSPCAPQFINDFLPNMPSAGTYCTAAAPTVTSTTTTTTTTTPVTTPVTTPAPISTPVKTTPKPTVTTSCTTVRGSALKVYGPKTAKLNKHGQAQYTFKLFVNLGKCKTPSAVGRQFYVYVDGKKTATLRTGKNGVQNYLVRLKPGKHTITAAFVGNKDLKKSSSSKFSARVV